MTVIDGFGRSGFAWPATLVRRVATFLAAARREVRRRRAFKVLADLDSRQLDDIGLLPEDIHFLAEQPFSRNAARAVGERARARQAVETRLRTGRRAHPLDRPAVLDR